MEPARMDGDLLFPLVEEVSWLSKVRCEVDIPVLSQLVKYFRVQYTKFLCLEEPKVFV